MRVCRASRSSAKPKGGKGVRIHRSVSGSFQGIGWCGSGPEFGDAAYSDSGPFMGYGSFQEWAFGVVVQKIVDVSETVSHNVVHRVSSDPPPE